MLKVKTIYDNREEFCQVLRSGRYTQVLGSRASGFRACALNVWYHHNHGRYNDYIMDKEGYCVFAQRTLGFESVVPIYDMNDDGKTFSDIAAWIEAQP